MARKAKVKEDTQVKKQPTVQPVKEKKTEVKVAAPVVEEPLNPIVENAMKLNPHMESMWITSRGFVHQATAPEYLRKDAKFYVNKFYNK